MEFGITSRVLLLPFNDWLRTRTTVFGSGTTLSFVKINVMSTITDPFLEKKKKSKEELLY